MSADKFAESLLETERPDREEFGALWPDGAINYGYSSREEAERECVDSALVNEFGQPKIVSRTIEYGPWGDAS